MDVDKRNRDLAREHLLDPLTAPEPNTEIGPGSRFSMTTVSSSELPSPPPSASPRSLGEARKLQRNSMRLNKDTTGGSTTSSNNPFRRSSQESRGHKPSISEPVHMRQPSIGNGSRGGSYNPNNPFLPSPPASASPRREHFESHRRNRNDLATVSAERTYTNSNATGRGRANSLSQRFPGDNTHNPLDMLRKDSRAARRAPHLSRKYMPGADQIDRLDKVLGQYHHEGPYDAALLSRNISPKLSPLQAVQGTNNETIRATPTEKIQDSLKKHRPLDGVAVVPPGMPDRFGRVYHYEEGEDMMRDFGGNYKRWPGVKYLPEDLKGKGEPSFSMDRAIKEHKLNNPLASRRSEDIEMTSRRPWRSHRSTDGGYELVYRGSFATANSSDGDSGAVPAATSTAIGIDGNATEHAVGPQPGMDRRHSTGRKLSDGIRRRLWGPKRTVS